MLQVARNVTDTQSGALYAKRYLVTDRDTKYSEQFRRLIGDSGTKVIRLPPMSPNLNAFAERFVRSIKDECLDRMIFVGQASLRRAVAEYLSHYHAERNHQGLENRLIVPAAIQANDGAVHRHTRLGCCSPQPVEADIRERVDNAPAKRQRGCDCRDAGEDPAAVPPEDAVRAQADGNAGGMLPNGIGSRTTTARTEQSVPTSRTASDDTSHVRCGRARSLSNSQEATRRMEAARVR